MTTPTPTTAPLPATGRELVDAALAGGLLPASTDRGPDGRLRVGGIALAELAERHDTPVLVLDENGIRETARALTAAVRTQHERVEVHFASKAFPAPAISGLLAEEGLGCDVVGGGELALALAGGVPAARILMHGNAKTDADLRAALDAGIGLIVIDGEDEVDRLDRLATDEQAVLLRINPGVEATTHEAMATGHDGSKFGVPVAEAPALIARLRDHPRLRLEGLHTHIGSQILDLEPFVRSVEPVSRFGAFDTYDLGGGLGVRYTLADPPAPTVEAYAEALFGAVHQHLGDSCRIIVEPGRALVARSGVTVYRVVSVKRTARHTFVSVDGGMGDNLEPSLYGQPFAPLVLDADGRDVETCEVVGRHCETGDRLVGSLPLARPRVGDLLIVPVTGAYCFTMANNYNAALRPPVVLVRDGDDRTVVRRESMDDLLARHLPLKRIG